MRFGIGYDTHKFTIGDHIMIGGVKIPHSQGLEAHSDGEVLLHAIIDALLGASGLGDIGAHFPDNDDTFRDSDSRVLLKHTIYMIYTKKLCVNNIDATIIAERPKIGPFCADIKEVISSDLEVSPNVINIKGTTNEKMGFIGRGEGIAAIAVCSLREI